MKSFVRQLLGELYKLFARKRTYLGFGVLVIVECAILLILRRPRSLEHFRQIIEQHNLSFEYYYSGLTIGLEIVILSTPMLVGLFLALVACDVVSKEVEEGTLRMWLCRPVSRTRIIAIKYALCVIFTFTLTFFLGLTALAVGVFCRGNGGLFVASPMEQLFAAHKSWASLELYFLALPFLALSLTSITSLGFMFSCLRLKPGAATVATLSIVFADFTFRRISYFESLHPLLLSTHLAAWQQIFATKIPWARLCRDYAYLLSVDVICFLLALAVFQRRDFKA